MAPRGRRREAGTPASPWATLVVSGGIMGLSLLLILRRQDPALAGALLSYVAGYWLPVRPNRKPPDPTDSS